ncbi:universal stress protein [Actinosynnema sp. NPDC047251]|uniref:universal stress protein n=1 Tax=Saccharothrix espanaensis TaxID=103731 RepID=UPI00130E0D06|nr:universal stress protein [Saccharothrix espanaensis]
MVGVDGSPASTAALTWAVAHARDVGARVVAVSVCRVRPTPPSDDRQLTPADAFTALHQRELDQAISVIDAGDVEIEARVPRGAAGPVLVAILTDADALVLGGHGYRRGKVSVIGPVIGHCLRHARIPVVVVTAGGGGDGSPARVGMPVSAQEFR